MCRYLVKKWRNKNELMMFIIYLNDVEKENKSNNAIAIDYDY